MRRASYILLFFIAAIATAQDRRAQPIVPRKQVALVIGNAAYLNRPLVNSVHDAEAMAQRLRELNFDVTLRTNTDRKTMGQAIEQFVQKLGKGDVAFFYYSGHGMQVDGENYLVPIDFQGQTESDARYDTHPVGKIQDSMERSGARLNMLVLDACRDNPYRSSVRSASNGLAMMNPGLGTFIAFATAPGRTASDNSAGRYGLFTQHLLEALAVRDLSLDDVFNLVRERVFKASGGNQLPWALSSVVGRFSFVPGETAGDASAPRSSSAKVNAMDGQRYLRVPAGTFTMGCSPGDTECLDDEKPAHRVTLTKGFWMGETAVTVEAYKRFAMATGNPMPADRDKLGRLVNTAALDDRIPVVGVSFDQAAKYCAWAGMRLPTEAEWEWAARAGSSGARYGNLDDIAWYRDNSGRLTGSKSIWTKDLKDYDQQLFDNGNGPKPVAQKQPNQYGLYDMLGNVWQWVADWYDPAYYRGGEMRDPSGPKQGTMRALRGASWGLGPRSVRVSERFGEKPASQSVYAGFRCAGD